MITKEQMLNGILSYIDAEVIPSLPTSGKWVVGTYICLISSKIISTIDTIINYPLIKALDICSSEGLIDENKLIDGLHTSAKRYGKIEFTVPVVGILRFGADDVAKLGGYLNRSGG